MSDKVVEFPGNSATNLGRQPRERTIATAAVAKGAVENAANLDMLVVIGVTHEGGLYAASTHPDLADTVFLLERFKRKLLLTFGEDEFAE